TKWTVNQEARIVDCDDRARNERHGVSARHGDTDSSRRQPSVPDSLHNQWRGGQRPPHRGHDLPKGSVGQGEAYQRLHETATDPARLTVPHPKEGPQNQRPDPLRLGFTIHPENSIGGFWGDPGVQGRGNLSKDEEFRINRRRPNTPPQLACSVSDTLKM